MKFKIGDLISLNDIEEEVRSLCLVIKIPDDGSPFYNCVPAKNTEKLIQTLEDEMEIVN